MSYVVPVCKVLEYQGRVYGAGDVVPGYLPQETQVAKAPIATKPKSSTKPTRSEDLDVSGQKVNTGV